MAEIVLKAQLRTEFGKGAARRTRRAGLVPAVMHPHKEAPTHISLPGHEAFLALRHSNAVITIDLDGQQTLTIAREIQRNALTDALEHVDLQVIIRGEKIEVNIPLHIEGETVSGVALLDSQDLAVRAEATQVPEVISVSVEGLVEGDVIRIRDLDLPDTVEPLEDPETAIVTVTAERSEEPETVETDSADTAPED
ncbi:MAG: 50S ribosomal protein L25/general stress protein Ctc [Bifidobacteriaceae bacterium]|jgi:large subunit ribosomal protein L25|nr:50S ribosomal protein L25/general stress protein Ctc [Bifidobacteriaceae bacterium]